MRVRSDCLWPDLCPLRLCHNVIVITVEHRRAKWIELNRVYLSGVGGQTSSRGGELSPGALWTKLPAFFAAAEQRQRYEEQRDSRERERMEIAEAEEAKRRA